MNTSDKVEKLIDKIYNDQCLMCQVQSLIMGVRCQAYMSAMKQIDNEFAAELVVMFAKHATVEDIEALAEIGKIQPAVSAYLSMAKPQHIAFIMAWNLVCLVTDQVISAIKKREENSKMAESIKDHVIHPPTPEAN